MDASVAPTLKMTIDLTETVVPVIRSEIAAAFKEYEGLHRKYLQPLKQPRTSV